AAEAVAETVEEGFAIVVIGGVHLGGFLALVADLFQHLLGLFIQVGGHDDIDVCIKLAVAIGAQSWHALVIDGDGFAWLGAGLDIDIEGFAIEVLDREGGAESGINHWHTYGNVQVIGIAFKDWVLLGMDFHIQITSWSTAVADFALVGHTNAHAIANARGDIHGDIAALLHAAIATTVVARIGDNFTKALALWTRTRSHNVA